MIQLMKKSIDPESLEVLYDRPFTPESFAEDFEIKDGKWHVDEEGWLIGENRNNSAAMVLSKGEYFGDVLLEFDAATILPSTRDIDVTWHCTWDEETNKRGPAYVCGVQGWWHGFVGFEKSPEYDFLVGTKLFNFEPGREYHVAVGNIGGNLFITIDGALALEVNDPNPLDVNKHGRIGFEAYCTRVKYKNLKIKRITYTDTRKPYDPEF